jgi:hypothetical protein
MVHDATAANNPGSDSGDAAVLSIDLTANYVFSYVDKLCAGVPGAG